MESQSKAKARRVANANAIDEGHSDVFRIGSISQSRLRKNGPCDLRKAARHNKREIQAEMGADGHIDATLSHKNRCIYGPDDADGVVALGKAAAADADVITSNLKKDHCQAIELLLSLPPESGVNEVQYFDRCLEWVGLAFPGLRVLSADVHNDEAAPHCHILISPFKGGDSIARDIKSPKFVGALRESFFVNVAGPAGLRRGNAKLYGTVKKMAVEAAIKALEAIGAADMPVWNRIKKDVQRDPLGYLMDLGIDPKELPRDYPAKPIVLETENPRPIVLTSPVDNFGQKDEGLCSVVLPINLVQSDTTKAPPELPQAMESRRQLIARQAHQEALERTATPRAPYHPTKVAECVSASLGGYRRVQDGDPLSEGW